MHAYSYKAKSECLHVYVQLKTPLHHSSDTQMQHEAVTLARKTSRYIINIIRTEDGGLLTRTHIVENVILLIKY